MTHVVAAPQLMEAAATDLAAIGVTLNAAHMAAADSIVAVLPAAADEVSAGIAGLFSDYGQDYQELAGQASVVHDQFVERLAASAKS
jgi:PE family